MWNAPFLRFFPFPVAAREFSLSRKKVDASVQWPLYIHMGSCQCIGVKKVFNDRMARRELKRYLKHGPAKSTQILLKLIRTESLKPFTLLDIGGGIGAIQHELYRNGLESSTDVDASPDYLETARREAYRRGNGEHSRFIEGDFTDDSIRPGTFDVVTLDRVICCYDEMEKLVSKSSSLARKIYGVVYPRETWVLKMASVFMRTGMFLLRNPYRMFVHPVTKIDQIVRENGFRKKHHRTTLMWRIDLYERIDSM